jgi:hypothetical protein
LIYRALILKIILLASLFLSLHGCAQSPEPSRDIDCARFERALTEGSLAEGREDECRRAKERCLAALDQTIKEYSEQMQALLTALGADTEREKVLRSAITKLEKDISELKVRRERFNAAECKKSDDRRL